MEAMGLEIKIRGCLMTLEMVETPTKFNSDGADRSDQLRPGWRPLNSVDTEEPSELARAAVQYAKLGIPVFQVKPGSKEPLSAHGFKDATTDIAKITKLWATNPRANIGIAMGELAVLDVDGDAGKETLFNLLGVRDPRDLTPLVAETPSGGWHLIFRRAGMSIRNRASDIGPGLDTRGVTRDGEPAGYIVVAPSIVQNGIGPKPYRWQDPNALERLDGLPPTPRKLAFLATFNKRERELIANDVELNEQIEASPPNEWLKIFDAHQPAPMATGHGEISVAYAHPYIQTILDGECDEIARAGFGAQEQTLNTASFRVGARLKQFGLSAHADDACQRLLEAAQQMPNERGKRPWNRSELREKIARGVHDGLAKGAFAPKFLEPGVVALPSGLDAEITQLASLHPILYDQQRKEVSKRLGIKTETLDSVVSQRRQENEAKSKGGSGLEDDEPWPEPVSGRELFHELVKCLKTYAILPPLSAEAIALWVIHAHALDAATHSPLLVLNSPEKRCGKTTVAKIVAALAPKGLHAANITAAVLFRVIDAYRPTIVIDEADTFLDLQDELRGIINGGHDRESAQVWRVEGEGAERKPEGFSVWAPKVIALIGSLPDTIEDRSIRVPLRRKLPSEQTERLPAGLRKSFADLRRQAARWATDNVEALRSGNPPLPDELNDRAGDNWRPLLAIADLINGKPSKVARDVASKLSLSADEDDTRTALLKNIRELFHEHANSDLPVHALLEGLNSMSEAPWGEYRDGKGLSARALAKMLRPFEIRSHETKNYNTYRRADFDDAFGRYLDGGEIVGEPMPPDE